MRWAGHVARMGRYGKCIQDFSRKAEDKRLLVRPRRRCKDDISMDLMEVGWEDVYCIHLAQDKDQWRDLVTAVLNLPTP
jgi:hypothetical protein